MTSEFVPDERTLTGKLNVDTGKSTRILNMNIDWQTVEEREQDGDTVQVIEGTFGAGREQYNPDYQAQINGTLAPDGNDLVLEVHGSR